MGKQCEDLSTIAFLSVWPLRVALGRARGISSHPTFLVLISNPHEKGGRDMFNEIGLCTLSPPPPPPPSSPSPKVLTPFMMYTEGIYCVRIVVISRLCCHTCSAATRHHWRKTDVSADPVDPVPLHIFIDSSHSSCTRPPLHFRLSVNQSNFGILTS